MMKSFRREKEGGEVTTAKDDKEKRPRGVVGKREPKATRKNPTNPPAKEVNREGGKDKDSRLGTPKKVDPKTTSTKGKKEKEASKQSHLSDRDINNGVKANKNVKNQGSEAQKLQDARSVTTTSKKSVSTANTAKKKGSIQDKGGSWEDTKQDARIKKMTRREKEEEIDSKPAASKDRNEPESKQKFTNARQKPDETRTSKKNKTKKAKKSSKENEALNGESSSTKDQTKRGSSKRESSGINLDTRADTVAFAQVVEFVPLVAEELDNDNDNTIGNALAGLPVAVPQDSDTPTSNEIGRLIKVSIPKPLNGETLGLRLRKVNQRIFVVGITPNSRYNGTAVRVGQKITSINGVNCFDKSVNEAVSLLHPADKPTTTMIVQTTKPSIKSFLFDEEKSFTITVKREPNKPIGVRFRDVNGQIYISRIEPDGAFGGIELLKQGYKVVRINDGEPVSCSDALALVRSLEGQTSLTVEPTPNQPNIPRQITSRPPPGAPDGGVWGTDHYIGPNSQSTMVCGCLFGVVSCFLFGLPSLWACCCLCGPLCCPCDDRKLYEVNGVYYTTQGKRTTSNRFKPYATR